MLNKSRFKLIQADLMKPTHHAMMHDLFAAQYFALLVTIRRKQHNRVFL
jgi:hypothetical protein